MLTEDSVEAVIDALAQLLSEERADILAGRYDNLPSYAERKEAYVNALDSFPITGDNLRHLSIHKAKIRSLMEKAHESESLIKAVKAGMQSAQTRITNLQKSARTVGAYAANGAKLQLSDYSTICRKLA